MSNEAELGSRSSFRFVVSFDLLVLIETFMTKAAHSTHTQNEPCSVLLKLNGCVAMAVGLNYLVILCLWWLATDWHGLWLNFVVGWLVVDGGGGCRLLRAHTCFCIE